MGATPAGPEFEQRFVEWYVWASQRVSMDARRCRAAAWAAMTADGTQQEREAIARKAAFGPEVDDLSERPAPDLRARAEAAALAAKPPSPGFLRGLAVVLVVIAVTVLVAGGVCYALVALNSSQVKG